jgi:hypothetical protein
MIIAIDDIMVMVSMRGAEGFVLERTDIRRRYEASGYEYRFRRCTHGIAITFYGFNETIQAIFS